MDDARGGGHDELCKKSRFHCSSEAVIRRWTGSRSRHVRAHEAVSGAAESVRWIRGMNEDGWLDGLTSDRQSR